MSRFTDEANIRVYAGKGGDGCVSFRREKYIPKGGPDGGNGGKGGNVYLATTTNAHTLSEYRTTQEYYAEDGQPGAKNNRTGRNGEDIILRVPVGTQVRNEHTNEVLWDLNKPCMQVLVAEGGIGGKGNAGFVSSIRQVPEFAELGDKGEKIRLKLDLKLVADVALVGYPSVGKSTIISTISAARPKIAEYHFTTLIPNLGVAKIDNHEMVFIDVPGLIKGAHEGKGLGHQFLRHIERAHIVLHVIDGGSLTPTEDLQTIRHELEAYSHILAEKPWLTVVNKSDLLTENDRSVMVDFFTAVGTKDVYFISAATGEGTTELLRAVAELIPQQTIEEEPENSTKESEQITILRPAEQRIDMRQVNITTEKEGWRLTNPRLEQMVRMTPAASEPAKERVYDVLKKWHIPERLLQKGANAGEYIYIGDKQWVFRG